VSAQAVLDLARSAGVRLATAESCTGGLIAAALTEIAGASDVLDCGFVTYSNAAKQSLLGVQRETLDRFGAVSEEVAREMALGARTRAGVDLAVSVTGIAGPGGSEFKPEGRVCFGLARRDSVTTQTVDFGALGRSTVRAAATEHALHLLLVALHPPRQGHPRPA
jgi:nicotinamide-nucleotide amidase